MKRQDGLTPPLEPEVERGPPWGGGQPREPGELPEGVDSPRMVIQLVCLTTRVVAPDPRASRGQDHELVRLVEKFPFFRGNVGPQRLLDGGEDVVNRDEYARCTWPDTYPPGEVWRLQFDLPRWR